MMCGGASEARPATADDQKIADELIDALRAGIKRKYGDASLLFKQIREAAEMKAGRKFPKYEVKLVKTQVVAGTNFFMKVDVGDGKVVHLRIYRKLPHAGLELELANLLEKAEEDELEYF